MGRNSKTSAAQQLKFVMECRKSGKTDAQWCIENGIRPATFYNWVSRLRTLGSHSIVFYLISVIHLSN